MARNFLLQYQDNLKPEVTEKACLKEKVKPCSELWIKYTHGGIKEISVLDAPFLRLNKGTVTALAIEPTVACKVTIPPVRKQHKSS